MLRSMTSVVAILAAASLAAPAIAADADEWGGDDWEITYRDSYNIEPEDWTTLGDDEDTISIETGIRYWYSMGGQTASDSSGNSLVTSSDTSHIGELYLRVEDHSTNTYAKAIAGYSVAISGDYSTGSESGTISDGHVGYVGADLGWNTFGDNNGSGLGVLVGYQYWQDAPNTGRNNFTTLDTGDTVTYDEATGQTFIPGDSASNYLDAHILRLGVQGKAKLGDFFDVSAEVAGVPYAKVSGVIGVDDPTFDDSIYTGAAQLPYTYVADGNIVSMRSSETSIDGWGYGAMAEVMLGVHPTENLTFRFGGRAWYLQGTADQTYSRAEITNPANLDADPDYEVAPTVVNASYIEEANPFSMFRYGLLAELTYAF